MIARASFENSLPRLASAAPFLCLIELHLLCPDMTHLPHDVEKASMDAGVVRQLGMEGSHDDPALAHEHWLAVQLSKHFDLGPDLAHPWRADEDAAQRLGVAGDRKV